MKKFMNSVKATKLAPFGHDKKNPDMFMTKKKPLKKKSAFLSAFGKA